jgi:short-subunit dehydrogenase
MSYFKDKVAWVTGASSGIGEELSRQLAAAGAKVILSARNTDKLTAIKQQLHQPNRHTILPFDLADSSEVDDLVTRIIEKYGKIDLLFNSGGVSQRSEASATELSVDRKIMEVNYFGNIALTKAVLPFMRKAQTGHIIVTSSIAGKFGFYLRSAYSASKHALHGFYESLLLEEAKNNIFVTLVCPGKINTPISKSALTKDGTAHGKMDHNQATGMPVEECVRKMLVAAAKQKKEVLIGNKEIKAVTLKRFFPQLFWNIIKKQKPT